MAAHGNNFIRVRLHFDYPPPAVVDCRMCWLLVDLNTCRVVADLESIIREKFEFSRRSILSLFIEECYLPHTESIYVVRDNDSVRVKVDYLAQVNGGSSHLDKTSDSCRKRHRPTEDDGPEENGLSVEWKKKKRKKASEESLEKVKKQDSANEKKKSHGKSTEKMKSKKDKSSTVAPKPAAPTKNSPVRVEQTVKSKKSQVKDVSSSDSSSSSEEDTPPKKTAAPKSAPKTPSSTLASSKAHSTSKPTQKKTAPPSSSSDSSSDEDTSVKLPPKTEPSTNARPKAGTSNSSQPQQTPPALHSSKPEQQQAAPAAAPPRDQVMNSSTSSSEEEIPFVIRRPLHQPGFGAHSQSSCRGRGRGNNWRGGRGERRMSGGRGGSGGQSGSMEPSCNGAKEPTYQTDSLTNTSVVLQNGAESAPKKDYSSMPLLAAPPLVGQRIAFKLLELTENYTPEVSEYKEGKIVSFDPTTKQIELELHSVAQAPVEPGKFDLVYQNPDGTERVEYAVSRDSRVTERWESLLEPRLII